MTEGKRKHKTRLSEILYQTLGKEKEYRKSTPTKKTVDERRIRTVLTGMY